LFVVPLFTWRIVARHISRQITVMYPRLLELERELKWEVDTVYILNNLSRWGWQELSEILKHTPAPCGQPERRNYLQYKESCRNNGIDVYAPLLMVWNELGYESVGSRGHTVQDIMVAIVSVATLAISSFIAIQNYLCYPCVIIISSVLFIGVIIVLLNLIVPRCHWN
jgi:hypothetical protein